MNIFLVFISAVMAFSLVFKYCLNLVWLAREVANGNIRSWKPKSDMEGKFNRDLIPKVSSNGKSAIVMMSTSWCLEHKVDDNFVLATTFWSWWHPWYVSARLMPPAYFVFKIMNSLDSFLSICKKKDRW